MAWLKQYKEQETLHDCKKPNVYYGKPGDEWECEVCWDIHRIYRPMFSNRQRWRRVGNRSKGTYRGDNGRYSKWKPNPPVGASPSGAKPKLEDIPKLAPELVKHLVSDKKANTVCCNVPIHWLKKDECILVTFPGMVTCEHYEHTEQTKVDVPPYLMDPS